VTQYEILHIIEELPWQHCSLRDLCGATAGGRIWNNQREHLVHCRSNRL